MSMEGVFAVIGGFLWLNEIITGRVLFGCGLMLAAMLLAQMPVSKKYNEFISHYTYSISIICISIFLFFLFDVNTFPFALLGFGIDSFLDDIDDKKELDEIRLEGEKVDELIKKHDEPYLYLYKKYPYIKFDFIIKHYGELDRYKFNKELHYGLYLNRNKPIFVEILRDEFIKEREQFATNISDNYQDFIVKFIVFYRRQIMDLSLSNIDLTILKIKIAGFDPKMATLVMYANDGNTEELKDNWSCKMTHKFEFYDFQFKLSV